MITHLRRMRVQLQERIGRLLDLVTGTFPVVFGLNPLVLRDMTSDETGRILRYRWYTVVLILASYAVLVWGVLFVADLTPNAVFVGMSLASLGILVYAFEWLLWYHDSPALSIPIEDLISWKPSPIRSLVVFILFGLFSSFIIPILSRHNMGIENLDRSPFSALKIGKQLDAELSRSKSQHDQELASFERDLVQVENLSRDAKVKLQENKQIFLSRKALVITLSDYKDAKKLPGVKVDASVIKLGLERAGFNVSTLDNVDRIGFEAGVQSYIGSLDHNDVSMVYVAGHGLQSDGQNYLLHLDFPLDRYASESNDTRKLVKLFAAHAIDLNHLIERVASSKEVRFTFFVIDACREVAGRVKGLADFTTSRTNLSVLAAASPGQLAIDSLEKIGHGGPVAYALAKHLVRGIDHVDLGLAVKSEVQELLKDFPPYDKGECTSSNNTPCANVPGFTDYAVRRFQMGLPAVIAEKGGASTAKAASNTAYLSGNSSDAVREVSIRSIKQICRQVPAEDCYLALKAWNDRAHTNRVEWSNRVKSASEDLEQSFTGSRSSLSYQMQYWESDKSALLAWAFLWVCLFGSYILLQRQCQQAVTAYKLECHRKSRWQIKHTHHLVDEWIVTASLSSQNRLAAPVSLIEKNWDSVKDFYPESDRVPDQSGGQVLRGELGHSEFEKRLGVVI